MMVQWTRWRDRVSLDIFLVFGSLAILVILERALRLTPSRPRGSVRSASASCWRTPICFAGRVALSARIENSAAGGECRTRRVAHHVDGGMAVSLRGAHRLRIPLFPMAARLRCLGVPAGARPAGGVTHWRMPHAALGALLLATFLFSLYSSRCSPVSREAAAALDAAGGARRGCELLLRVRAADMDSAHVAVVRALRISVRSRAGRQPLHRKRRAESAVHVCCFRRRRHRRFRGIVG